MEQKIKEMFLNIGEPQFSTCESIYDLHKKDIRALRETDNYFLKRFENWKEHKTRKLLIKVINEWCEMFRCYSLYYYGESYEKENSN